jgi:putative ABC transport system permease protein
MLSGAVTRQKRKLLMMAAAMALGISLATAMLNVMLDVGDKMNQELKAYGANILVTPRGASLLSDLYGVEEGAGVSDQYLAEEELVKIKTIFWAFNIVDFTPYLDIRVKISGAGVSADSPVTLTGTWFSKHLEIPTGESVDTGVIKLKSWWDVDGAWINDQDASASESGAMAGSALAARAGLRLGDAITVASTDITGRERSAKLVLRAIFHSGDKEDENLFVPLSVAQELGGLSGRVSRMEVSALTTPENELARRAAQNPRSLSRQDWEVWYCTAYVSAIAFQIEEVLTGARAKPVLQVAESEGAILQKIQLLMLLLTVLSLACAALAISNLVTANIMERGTELGLLKALGATDGQISLTILAEMLLATAGGGIAGYFIGLGLASVVGHTVFGADVAAKPLIIPIISILVLLVTLGGSFPAIRMILRLKPTEVLHER